MNIIITDDYDAMSRAAADIVVAAVAEKPDLAVVLPTGNTPVGMYKELAARKERGEFDASRLRVFQLDSYIGLTPDDPRSLYGWMDRVFLQPCGVPAEHVIRLPGDTTDPGAACRAYDDIVRQAGGFDLSVLGLGPNGHLGFNEPPVTASDPTRVVRLTEESIESNTQYWGARDRVPTTAMTCGMAQLLAARQTVLVVSGVRKRDILRRALHGPVTGDVPASFLRQAANVTVVADREALPE